MGTANPIVAYPLSGGSSAPSGTTLIGSQVIASATTAVSFTAIPQTYTNLRLVISGVDTTGTSGINMTFNQDGGANYSYLTTSNNGSAVTGSGVGAQTSGNIGGMAAAGITEIDVLITAYSKTTLTKGYLSSNGIISPAVATFMQSITGQWNSTAAITRIDLSISPTTFIPGTVFSLYGLS